MFLRSHEELGTEFIFSNLFRRFFRGGGSRLKLLSSSFNKKVLRLFVSNVFHPIYVSKNLCLIPLFTLLSSQPCPYCFRRVMCLLICPLVDGFVFSEVRLHVVH